MTADSYVPVYVGTVTKYVFVDSPDTTPQNLAVRAYEISEGLMIKETCFGLQVTGKKEEVDKFIREIRKSDPARIFVKDRGFPPGDPRRCRANLGGSRPGYLGHEFETGLLRYVSRGLMALEKKGEASLPPLHTREKLQVEKLQKIISEEEP